MALVAFPLGGPTTILNTLLLFLYAFGLAFAITDGPLAIVSLQNEVSYQTARFCAAGCLVYNGVDTCSTGPAYNDVGVFLGCRKCAPINACYCAPPYGSSVTSFMSSCVSLQCGASVQNWVDEVTSMLSIYNGYCATANVIPMTTGVTSVEMPTMTTTPRPAPKTPAVDTTSITTPPHSGLVLVTTTVLQVTTTLRPATRTMTDTASESTGTATTTSFEDAPGEEILSPVPSNGPDDEKEGLSESDIVALVASLCIGVPSLIIALATLWIQLRRRQQRRDSLPSKQPRTSPSTSRFLLPRRGPHGYARGYNWIGVGQNHEVHELEAMTAGSNDRAT